MVLLPRRRFMFPSFVFLLAIFGLSQQSEADSKPSQDQPRPNVVLILADDLGWRDLHCTGSDFYESPNLDALAAKASVFTQGYAACQVCSPSRAAIMTGKFPARMKTTDWFGAAAGTQWKRNTKLLPAEYSRELPDQETTLAEAFRAAGYKTFFAGKWHLGGEGSLPEDHGFDVNVGGHHRGSPPGGFFAPFRNPKLQDEEAGQSLPLRLGEETCRFIAQHEDEPFFAMLSFYSVHAPVQTTKELWQKYRDKASNGPKVDNRFIIDRTLQPVRQVQDHPVYAGMIEAMDQAVGKVINQLEQSNLTDNTIIVFTSDNGGVSAGDAKATSNLPLRGGKGRQWEGGIREPFFISVPSIPAQKINTPVISTDLFPTLLDLCDIPLIPDQHLDGVSLTALLQGKTIQERPLYWHYPHYGNQGGEPSAIIREGDLKLIHYFEDSRIELYDISSDSAEQNDLSKVRLETARRMNHRLQQWLTEIDANMPTPNPNYDAERDATAMRQLKTKGLQRLENEHARFLNEAYQPGPNWWGSIVD